MSAIRPDLPATTTPQAVPAGVRNAQAAFFRAAMADVQASQPQRPQAVQPQVTQTTTRASEPERAVRPGSLLDIRV